MGISSEQLAAYRAEQFDNATGLKTILTRMGQLVPAPPRIRIPGITPAAETEIKDSTKMLLAMARRPDPRIYMGTVPGHVKAQRRRRNKAARHARRVHRG